MFSPRAILIDAAKAAIVERTAPSLRAAGVKRRLQDARVFSSLTPSSGADSRERGGSENHGLHGSPKIMMSGR